MTFDYTSLRDGTVEPLIAQFGKAATLTQPGVATGPEYDPTPGTPTVYAVTVVETRFSMADKAGTLVQEDDRMFLMSTANDPVTDLKGALTLGGDTLQVINLEPLKPGLVVMLWRVHCRK